MYAMPREGMADEAKVLSHTAHANQSIAAAACGIGNCRFAACFLTATDDDTTHRLQLRPCTVPHGFYHLVHIDMLSRRTQCIDEGFTDGY